MADLTVKKGDLEPGVKGQLIPPTGFTLDLDGASVAFSLREEHSGQVIIEDAEAEILSVEDKIVYYAWEAGDTDTAGDYEGEFKVTLASGRPITFPSGRFVRILIHDTV